MQGSPGLRKNLPALLLVELMLALVAWPEIQVAQAAGPSGSMTQYGFNECFSSPCSVVLTNSVTSGHVLVVAVGYYGANYYSSMGDTLSTSFSQVGSTPVQSSGLGGLHYLYLFYGAAPSTGADTVTVTSSSSTMVDVWAVEVSGVDVSSPGTGTGSGSSSTFQTSPVSFSSEGFLIAFVFSGAAESTDNPAFTSGFTSLLAPSNGGSYNTWGEYSTGSVSTPTTFTVTSASDTYAEAGIAFNQPAIPDLPLGIFPVFLVIPVLYLLGRRWRAASIGNTKGPTSV